MTRILEIHGQDLDGWYFTVHEGNTLLYSSTKEPDRVKVTLQGIKYLDGFNLIDYKLRSISKERKQ